MKTNLLLRALITIIALLNAAALIWWAPNLLMILPLVVAVSLLLDWLSKPRKSDKQQQQKMLLLEQDIASIQADFARLQKLAANLGPLIEVAGDKGRVLMSEQVEERFKQIIISIQDDVNRLCELNKLTPATLPDLDDWIAAYTTTSSTPEQQVPSRRGMSIQPAANEVTFS